MLYLRNRKHVPCFYRVLYNNLSYSRTLLVLAYDLLEDRCIIDVIITKFFPLRFKKGERLENLDNIIRDWEKEKIQKSPVDALNRYEKQKEEKTKPVSFLSLF